VGSIFHKLNTDRDHLLFQRIEKTFAIRLDRRPANDPPRPASANRREDFNQQKIIRVIRVIRVIRGQTGALARSEYRQD